MKNEEKTKKRKKGSGKKRLIIFSIVFSILFICIPLIYLLIIRNNVTDVQKISKQISKLFDNMITSKFEEADQENKFSYIEKADGYIKDVRNNEEELIFSIEKYNSNEEANAKLKYIQDVYSMYHDNIDGKFVSTISGINSFFEGEKDLKFIKGIYLITLPQHYKSFKNEIIDILNNYDISNINVTNIDDINSYWKEEKLRKEKEIKNDINKKSENEIASIKASVNSSLVEMESCKNDSCQKYLDKFSKYKAYDEVKEQYQLIQNKYDEIISKKKEIANNISSSITKIENSLNETDYEAIKKQIEKLDDTFFDSYKHTWERRLDAIDEKIYKKACKSYSYKDTLRNPNDYKGKKTYWFGVVQQKISSSQYRIGVDCTKYYYISGYSCKNTIYVSYYGEKNIIEDDVVKMWGIMSGQITYQAVLGNDITIPSFIAKYINIQ